MRAHWVPLPEAGAPLMMTFRGLFPYDKIWAVPWRVGRGGGSSFSLSLHLILFLVGGAFLPLFSAARVLLLLPGLASLCGRAVS